MFSFQGAHSLRLRDQSHHSEKSIFLDLFVRNVPLQNNRKHQICAVNVIKVLKSSGFEYAPSSIPVSFFIAMEIFSFI